MMSLANPEKQKYYNLAFSTTIYFLFPKFLRRSASYRVAVIVRRYEVVICSQVLQIDFPPPTTPDATAAYLTHAAPVFFQC
jgi:hypothetical protein